MTPEQQGRLERQKNLGKDNGLRLRLQWDSGFSVVVHSWEAAAAITGRNKLTLPVYYSSGRLAEGLMCRNPDTYRFEECFLTVEQPGKRGAPADPTVKRRKLAELDAKIARAQIKIENLKRQRDELAL